MINNTKKVKIAIVIFTLLGIVIIIDTFLFWANISEEQDNLTLGYCIGFILVSSQYPEITKSKFVMIPFYILVLQMLYSILIYFF